MSQLTNHQINLDSTDLIENLRFQPVSPKYRSVQIASASLAYAVLAAVAALLLQVEPAWWFIVAEALIVISFVINLIILNKAYLVKGYALREHDITFRSGVIFPKMTTLPFSRIQQVSISQNPISKYFGLYAIDIVNGAQSLSSLSIKGLPKEYAERIKQTITQRLDECHD